MDVPAPADLDGAHAEPYTDSSRRRGARSVRRVPVQRAV